MFLLVFLSTLPVVMPFVLMTNITLALRLSNAIAIVMLFALGHAFGRIAGRPPLRAAFAMVAVGIVLVGITMALGG